MHILAQLAAAGRIGIVLRLVLPDRPQHICRYRHCSGRGMHVMRKWLRMNVYI